MRKIVTALLLAVALLGCAVTGTALGPSPEAQIVNGANAVTAATTLATVLLKRDRITVTQAKGYRSILGTASNHLDTANTMLLQCRKGTQSTSAAKPDPCAPSVLSDIQLAVSIVGEVQSTLKAKE